MLFNIPFFIQFTQSAFNFFFQGAPELALDMLFDAWKRLFHRKSKL